MASSRIFVRGLPPTLTEEEFKKHFSAKYATTDTKLFPQRRIGYVGYQSPEEASKAIKFFNKTFMRMSRIYVESARPVTIHDPRAKKNPTQDLSASTHSSTRVAVVDPTSDSRKRKRGDEDYAGGDSKLQEYLEVMQRPSKSKMDLSAKDAGDREYGFVADAEPNPTFDPGAEAESDGEYQQIQKKSKIKAPVFPPTRPQISTETLKSRRDEETAPNTLDPSDPSDVPVISVPVPNSPPIDQSTSDAEWLRTRTSRLLDLESDADEDIGDDPPGRLLEDAEEPSPRSPQLVHEEEDDDDGAVRGEDEVLQKPVPQLATGHSSQTESGGDRLYVRNLPYGATENNLKDHFSPFGELQEVHVPINKKTGAGKGFAYVQFEDEQSAKSAMAGLDGTIFQGRLLHILPASAKKSSQLDEFAISKLPLKKQQQIRRKAEATTSTFNWNSLYMNMDAVMSSVASRLGVDKSELLDPTSSDAAVKQAHAETHVISETKSYFTKTGVDLEAFRKRERGDTAILVKNFPFNTTIEELRNLLEQFGTVIRLLVPPSGTIAVVQFAQPTEARAAFGSLAYRKFKDSILFLEKAPKDLFKDSEAPSNGEASEIASASKDAKISANDLLQKDVVEDIDTSTLFVRNLNFSTTTQRLNEVFKPLDGFVSATVKTKLNPKDSAQKLSMGFGFLEFRTKDQAQAALSAMNGYSLDGHKLLIRASHKGADAAEERRKEDKAKKDSSRYTKIVIKNLPFETSKKDIRSLFGAYGQLRSVRVPKKFDHSARGFAFAEFTTPREAETAMDALRNTHLLGRRLVLEFASQEAEDAEEELERMQEKVGSQVNKVALQRLTGGGRKKFNVAEEEGDG